MKSIRSIHQQMKREAQRRVSFLPNEGERGLQFGTFDPVNRPYVC
ncbi:hypothetical protein [Aureitalea marina]|nr:hypothetical protein [Aureitalea marina]